MRRDLKARHRSWWAGFTDGISGRRPPTGEQVAYRSGYFAGLAQRTSQRIIMVVAVASTALPAAASVGEDQESILTAIDEHRQAWEALSTTNANYEHWHQAFLAAELKLVESRPTTPAGITALRDYDREARRRGRPYQPPPQFEYWGTGKG